MDPGNLRHAVLIQSPPAGALSDRGQKTGTWSDVATVWAQIETLRGDELVEARKIVARATYRVTIRHYSGLTTAHRLKLINQNDRILHIGHIDNIDQRGAYNVLTCTES